MIGTQCPWFDVLSVAPQSLPCLPHHVDLAEHQTSGTLLLSSDCKNARAHGIAPVTVWLSRVALMISYLLLTVATVIPSRHSR